MDPRTYLRLIPPHATAKGMFYRGICDSAQRRVGKSPTKKDYAPFKDYPLVEFAQLAVDAAQLMYPDLPLREGLRRVGHEAFAVLEGSLIGKLLYGALGRDPRNILPLVRRSYESSMHPSSVETLETTDSTALIRYEAMFSFVDSYHVGVLEGVFRTCGLQAEVTLRTYSLSSVDMFCAW